jgi:putative ABC transport system permease protein
MSVINQVGVVTAMNLRNVPQRLGTSLVIVIGVAGVVAVLISVMAMATGLSHTVAATAHEDRAIIIRGSSGSELQSTLSRDAAAVVRDAPGIRKTAEGRPIASAEALLMVNLPKKGETEGANVALRGVEPLGIVLRKELRIIEGRMFQPAVHELIVGKAAQAQFVGLDVGKQISIRGNDWNIVGSFESDGDSHESEMFADVETVLSAYRRNLYQAVIVQLESPASFDALKDALTTNPALTVDVNRETEYYAAQSKQLSAILFFVAYFVGGIMAVGAMFGALNTMYSAVSARRLEIATLRAIGFGSGAVVISIFVEAIMLALAGGLLGSVLAWAFFDGNIVSTLGGNFTQLVFPLTVTTGLVALGITWACGIGLIGASFPAIRAARLPVAAALQAQ